MQNLVIAIAIMLYVGIGFISAIVIENYESSPSIIHRFSAIIGWPIGIFVYIVMGFKK